MIVRYAVLLGCCYLVGGVVFAQDSQKVEATGDYSYFSVEPWTCAPSAFCAA